MATAYEIPLTPGPQAFAMDISGVTYRFRFLYLDVPEAGWVMDISDAAGAPLVCGVPLVTGADLLGQYAYLGINAVLQVVSDEMPDAVPTYGALGTTSHLLMTVPT